MTKERIQEFTLRISGANATELVVILYEMMLDYLKEAEEALKQDMEPDFHQAVRKARGCLNELMNSLHLEYEPAPALLQLYLYCLRTLARAELYKKEEELQNVEKVIEPLKDAYSQIAPMNTKGAVMNNSQTVYAGLTYGKNTLTENLADPGANRGMFA